MHLYLDFSLVQLPPSLLILPSTPQITGPPDPPYTIRPPTQRVEEHDSTEGRSARPHDVEQGGGGEGNHVGEMKGFLKEAQQVREKIVFIESLVVQIKSCHMTITGEAARNEGERGGLVT